MKGTYKAVKVSDNVYWVGAVDWNIRDFHGYSTRRGSTYNAYLVLADKVTLIDAVKAPFKDELLSRIASVIEPSRIDYIVSNHSEMDHTGSLFPVIDVVHPERVVASAMGVKAISSHFHSDYPIQAVGDGDTLDLGNMTLTFLETRMLHWPDSMVSYLDKDALLFSQDGFGMHPATRERFADEIDEGVLRQEAERYYANILMPFSPLIEKLLVRMGKLALPINILAPDHGPIYRTKNSIQAILGSYARFAAQRPTTKAVVLYDTMWHSTEAMALSIAEELVEGGASVKLLSMSAQHRSDAVTELLDAGALVVGSPTLNNNILPSMADVLTYIRGLKPRNLVGAAFGSFEWSGEAVGQIQNILESMKVKIVAEPLKVQYVPDDDALAKCNELGKQVAEKMKEIIDKKQESKA